MPIITSRDRLQVSCRIGKRFGTCQRNALPKLSTQAQRDDTVKREYAETRYAENTLIWIACYMVRYKVRQSYEKKFAVRVKCTVNLGTWLRLATPCAIA